LNYLGLEAQDEDSKGKTKTETNEGQDQDSENTASRLGSLSRLPITTAAPTSFLTYMHFVNLSTCETGHIMYV